MFGNRNKAPPTRIQCPKCGRTKVITSQERPIKISCECGMKLMVKGGPEIKIMKVERICKNYKTWCKDSGWIDGLPLEEDMQFCNNGDFLENYIWIHDDNGKWISDKTVQTSSTFGCVHFERSEGK